MNMPEQIIECPKNEPTQLRRGKGSLKGDAKEATGPMMCVQGPPAKIAGELQNDSRAYITFMKLWKGTEHNGLR